MNLLPIKRNPNFYIEAHSEVQDLKRLKTVTEKVCTLFVQNCLTKDKCIFYKTGVLVKIDIAYGSTYNQWFFNNNGDNILTVLDGLAENTPSDSTLHYFGTHEITPTDEGLQVQTTYRGQSQTKEQRQPKTEFYTYGELNAAYKKRTAEFNAKQKAEQEEQMWRDRAQDTHGHGEFDGYEIPF